MSCLSALTMTCTTCSNAIPPLARLLGSIGRRFQKIVNRYSLKLDDRKTDATIRKEELELDLLEEHFLCCVCRRMGEERDVALRPRGAGLIDSSGHYRGPSSVAGDIRSLEFEMALQAKEDAQLRMMAKKHRDKGLVRIHSTDCEAFSRLFGRRVRGFLCDTCMGVARSCVEAAKRNVQKKPNRVELESYPGAARNDLLFPLPDMEKEWITSRVRCMECHSGHSQFFDKKRKTFCCSICHFRLDRSSKRQINVLQPMPEKWIVFLTSLVRVQQGRLRKAHESSAQRKEQPLTLFGPEADLFSGWRGNDSDNPSQLKQLIDATSSGPTRILRRAGPVAVRFSDASFEELEARMGGLHTSLRSLRHRIRCDTSTSLFQGVAIRAEDDLFRTYWGPMVHDDTTNTPRASPNVAPQPAVHDTAPMEQLPSPDQLVDHNQPVAELRRSGSSPSSAVHDDPPALVCDDHGD